MRRLTPAFTLPTLEAMEIQPTADQEAFIKHAIESGRLHREEDAVREALSLWEERERARVELSAALDEAESDLEAGHYAGYTDETLPQLAAELKHEARALGDAPRSVPTA
jgi:Arc/MetJ-type ribon-helix-helix transcriptional regulator